MRKTITLKSSAIAVIFVLWFFGFLGGGRTQKPERIMVCLYKLEEQNIKPVEKGEPTYWKDGEYLVFDNFELIGTTTTLPTIKPDYSKKIRCEEVMNIYNWRELVDKPAKDEIWEILK